MPQDAPKTAHDGLRTAPSQPQVSPKTAPRGSQDAPKNTPRSSLHAPWANERRRSYVAARTFFLRAYIYVSHTLSVGSMWRSAFTRCGSFPRRGTLVGNNRSFHIMVLTAAAPCKPNVSTDEGAQSYEASKMVVHSSTQNGGHVASRSAPRGC